MPINYTNRKGQTYTLYRGQTRTGKPRYYFGRADQGQGEPVTELPAGYTISESINGVVSLIKDKYRPALIQPEEEAAVEAAVRRHPKASRYRVVVKGKRIEVYERAGDDYETVVRDLGIPGLWRPGLTKELRDMQERYARYEPVLRFNLIDPAERWFGVERMCYRSSVDGWLELKLTQGPVGELARELIPTLGTDQFFDLW
jgi:hypothetical protein